MRLPIRFFGSVLFAVGLAASGALAQTLNRAATSFPAAGVLVPTASVAFGNGTFVALGLKGRPALAPVANALSAHTSADGNVWTERVIDIPNVSLSNHGVVRFIGNQFVFTGSATSGSYVARSSDGVSWTISNPANLPPGNGFQEISSGAGTSVGIFGTTLSSSADGGASWTARTAAGVATTVPYFDLTYGNGRFVLTATGTATRVWTSPDAATWTEILAGQQNSGRIAYGNGIFVLSGANFKTSTDGVTFTVRPTPANFVLTGTVPIYFMGGRFFQFQFLFTPFGQPAPGRLVGSGDGLTWSQLATFASDLASVSPLGFAEGNNRLVSVGYQNTGTILNPLVAAVVSVLDTTTLPALPTPPVISSHPAAQNAIIGGSATFAVTASGTGNTYQWRKDGANLAGATSTTFTLTNLAAANAGSYTAVITNPQGSVTSNAATLTLVSASNVGRLINLSILSSIAAAGESFTMGYVVGGSGTSGTKPILARAVGPSLTPLGVGGPLGDPRLETFGVAGKTGENDNWGGTAALSSAFTAVGAFAYTGGGSLDAAVLANLSAGDNSVKVSANGNGTGAVLAELYDSTPADSFNVATPRLINVSVLKHLGTGLTAGFAIGGATAKSVLIRAVGPTIAAAPFSVPGAVSDPQLSLFSGQTVIGSNDNWAGTPALTNAFIQVGAFALPSNSRDAALLITLQPGSYTVQVSGVGGTTGVAIVEIYEAP